MKNRETSYGQSQLSIVDRFGVALSYRTIKRRLPKNFNSILDIGCGFNAALLLKAGADKLKYGIDFQVNKELITTKTSLIEGEGLTSLKAIPIKFDVIMLISVLEHISDPKELLKECIKHLNPQGRVLINVPTWTGKPFLEYSAFKLGLSPAIEMNDHKMYYNKRDLWPLLVQAGFFPQNIKLEYHKFGLNLFATALNQ